MTLRYTNRCTMNETDWSGLLTSGLIWWIKMSWVWLYVMRKCLSSSTVSFKNARWSGEGVIVMVLKGVLRTTSPPFLSSSCLIPSIDLEEDFVFFFHIVLLYRKRGKVTHWHFTTIAILLQDLPRRTISLLRKIDHRARIARELICFSLQSLRGLILAPINSMMNFGLLVSSQRSLGREFEAYL